MSADYPLNDSRHPQWNQGHIHSTAGSEHWTRLGLAAFWNALAHPMFWLVALNQPDAERWAIALTALFPLVGLGLAYSAAVKWLQWRRFGNLALQLDPFPGSLGGDVGGTCELPIAYRAGKSVEVTLSCVNVVIRRGHKNSRRSERVVWREHASVSVEPGMRGSRVRFLFKVPADRPATSEPSDNAHKWVVHLQRTLPGADLDQTFEIPVLDTGEPLRARQLRRYSSTDAGADAVTGNDVVVESTAEGLRCFYPRSRNRGMGVTLLVFGATFGLVPWFIGTQFHAFADGGAFGMIFILFGGLFILVFGLIGLLLTAFALYSLLNSLEVRVTADGVVSTRRILGFRATHALRRAAIKELSFRINAQQGDGAKAKVQYVLQAIPVTGKPVCLGDSIKGKSLARRLMRELGNALGHADWVEVKRRSAARRLRESRS